MQLALPMGCQLAFASPADSCMILVSTFKFLLSSYAHAATPAACACLDNPSIHAYQLVVHSTDKCHQTNA